MAVLGRTGCLVSGCGDFRLAANRILTNCAGLSLARHQLLITQRADGD
jgi:hypothetical protein